MVELKFKSTYIKTVTGGGINRTMVELKSEAERFAIISEKGINRTMVELKYGSGETLQR